MIHDNDHNDGDDNDFRAAPIDLIIECFIISVATSATEEGMVQAIKACWLIWI